MARVSWRRPVAGVFSLFASVWICAQAPATQWLQYDAAIVQNLPFIQFQGYALFVRYHVDAEQIAAEVIHTEPAWNTTPFPWETIGLALHSEDHTLTVHNTWRDRVLTFPKPRSAPGDSAVDGREAKSATSTSPEALVRDEADMLARIAAFREALLPDADTAGPVSIERDGAGRIERVTYRLGEDSEPESTAQYRYGGGDLDEIVVDSSASKGPGGSSNSMMDYEGGRETRVRFETIELEGGPLQLPVHIEVRRSDDDLFLRSARHTHFVMRSLAPSEAPPWETWENARRTQAEHDHVWTMANESYWLGDQQPSAEHAAFYREFMLPLATLESDYEVLGERLRAFRNAYMSAMVLGDHAYLREGFPWYLAQMATLESPELLLFAGQECIRLLIRWGYEDFARDALRTWRAAVFAMDGPDLERALAQYVDLGQPYYTFHLFDPDALPALQKEEQFRAQHRRVMALRRVSESQRERMNVMGYVESRWAQMPSHEWARLVEREHEKATAMYGDLDWPSPELRHLYNQLSPQPAPPRREGLTAAP